MKKITSLIFVIIIVLGIFTYTKSIKNTHDTKDTNIHIGTILSQTGVANLYGTASLEGINLAVEEINNQGGINGSKVTIIHEDDKSDPKTGVGLYKKLTSIDHVDGIIGSNFDFVVTPIFSVASTSDTVIISPTTARIPGSTETNRNSFTILSDFSKIIFELDNYLTKTPYKKMAVIHYTGGFGEEITKTITSITKKNNKGDVIEETYNQFGITDWGPYILKMKKNGVDIVFADMLGNDFIRFATQAKQLGLQAQLITHMDIRDSITDEAVDVTSVQNVVVLNWDVLGDDKDFSTRFKAKYGHEPKLLAAQAYMATYVLAEAIEKSKESGEALPIVLEKNTFTTLLGKYSFTKEHSGKTTPVKIQIIKGRELIDYK